MQAKTFMWNGDRKTGREPGAAASHAGLSDLASANLERQTPNTPTLAGPTPNAERRTPNAKRRTPNAKRICRLFAGVTGILVVAISALGLQDPLASMSGYTAALMALNQIAPPLLLLALPRPIRGGRLGCGKACGLIDFLLDPWAGTILFIGLSIAVSLPGVFDRSVVNALYAAPLGVLELGAGLLFWAQFMPATRSIRPGWLAGTVAWAGAMPMTVVAVVWMLSPDVLYTPYLNVICRWNIPPILDQRWAGLLMFVAGLPIQLVGAWLLIESLPMNNAAPKC